MPDWQELVHERFAHHRSGPAIEPEVSEELAHYLEDCYEAGLNNGLAEHEAAECALAEVRNWPRLARRILHAKRGDDMFSRRLQTLWLPGIATMAVSTAILRYFTGPGGNHPQIVWLIPGVPIVFYWPWLASLPVIGAAAAWWSRARGGEPRLRIASALFSTGAMVAIFFVILPIAIVVDRHVHARLILIGFLSALIGWVMVPSAALLFGALPFLRAESATSKLRAGAT